MFTWFCPKDQAIHPRYTTCVYQGLVESYVTRHVGWMPHSPDETSFIQEQTNSTLIAPPQSRIPQAGFVASSHAEEVTAEKKTGLS